MQDLRSTTSLVRWGRALVAGLGILVAAPAVAQDNITPSFTLRDAANKDYSVLVKDGQLMVGPKGAEVPKKAILVSFGCFWMIGLRSNCAAANCLRPFLITGNVRNFSALPFTLYDTAISDLALSTRKQAMRAS